MNKISTSQVHNLITELESEYPDSMIATKDLNHDQRTAYMAKLELIEYMKLKLTQNEEKKK